MQGILRSWRDHSNRSASPISRLSLPSLAGNSGRRLDQRPSKARRRYLCGVPKFECTIRPAKQHSRPYLVLSTRQSLLVTLAPSLPVRSCRLNTIWYSWGMTMAGYLCGTNRRTHSATFSVFRLTALQRWRESASIYGPVSGMVLSAFTTSPASRGRCIKLGKHTRIRFKGSSLIHHRFGL